MARKTFQLRKIPRQYFFLKLNFCFLRFTLPSCFRFKLNFKGLKICLKTWHGLLICMRQPNLNLPTEEADIYTNCKIVEKIFPSPESYKQAVLTSNYKVT